MLTIYHAPQSRSSRFLWLLEELGQPYQVKVVSINERVLPEVTDEWAKQIGPFQSVEELKTDVRQKLGQGYTDLTQRITESRILEEILKRSKIEFPSAMVQMEMEEEARELGQDLQKRGISYEAYLQQIGLTEEQHRERMACSRRPFPPT